MFVPLRNVAIALAASLSLTACYNDGYGHSRVSVGYGASYPSYYGWYDDFYYPGTGYYVYDRGGHRQRWNDRQSRYWTERQRNFRGADRADRRQLRNNWQAFRQDRRTDDRAFRQARRQDRQTVRAGQVTREQFRQNRQADRQAARQELRQDRQDTRRENRRDRRRPN